MNTHKMSDRQAAIDAIMQEGSFAIVYDGNGRTIYVTPSNFTEESLDQMEALAIITLQSVLECPGCTFRFISTFGESDNQTLH